MLVQRIVTSDFRIGSGTTPRSQIPFTETINGGRLVQVETAIGPSVAVVNQGRPTPSHFYVSAAFAGLSTLPFVSPATNSILEASVVKSDLVNGDSGLVRLTCNRSDSADVSVIRRDLVSYFARNVTGYDFSPVSSALRDIDRAHVSSNGLSVAFERGGHLTSLLICGNSPIAEYAILSGEFGFAQSAGSFTQISIDSLRFYRLTLAVFSKPQDCLGFSLLSKLPGAMVRKIGADTVDLLPISEIFDIDSSLALKPASRSLPVSGYPHPIKLVVLCKDSSDSPNYLVVDRAMEDPRVDLIVSKLNLHGASIRTSDLIEATLSDGSVATFIPLDSVTRSSFISGSL